MCSWGYISPGPGKTLSFSKPNKIKDREGIKIINDAYVSEPVSPSSAKNHFLCM